jgi:hypothetical protein
LRYFNKFNFFLPVTLQYLNFKLRNLKSEKYHNYNFQHPETTATSPYLTVEISLIYSPKSGSKEKSKQLGLTCNNWNSRLNTQSIEKLLHIYNIEHNIDYLINNLMKLGGSLGNVAQKLKKKLVIKTRYISDC